MRYLLLFSLLLGLCRTGIAQLPPALNVTVYNQANSINNGQVTTALQAKNGLLWFGTTNGLLSFDGYAFRHYNDPAIINSISRLAEDSTHCIWMSFLGGGLARFNPATGVFKNYKVHNASDTTLGTTETALHFDSKGQLWLMIARKGLVKADILKDSFSIFSIIDEKNTFYSSEFMKVYNTVYAIHEDKTGVFWLATHDGLYRFNPRTGEKTAMRAKPLQKDVVRYDLFGSIVADKDTLWLSAWSGGVSAYAMKTDKWATYLPDGVQAQSPLANPQTIMANVVILLAPKNKEELWTYAFNKGLGVFNKSQKQFHFFSEAKGYPSLTGLNFVNIIPDKDNNLWGLGKEGLTKVQARYYTFLFAPVKATKNKGSGFFITDMWEDAHWQLMGMRYGDGLQVLDKRTGKKTTFPIEHLPTEEQDMPVRHIFKDSRNVFWVVTRDFIYQYDTTRNALIKIKQPPQYLPNKPSNSFTHAAEDKVGNIWLTTKRNGVFVYNPTKNSYTHYVNTGTDAAHFLNTSHLIDDVTDAQGRVWLSGGRGFLGYFDPITKKIVQLVSGEGIAAQLKATQSETLLADPKGNIWVGTYNGLYYFDCQGSVPLLQKSFHAKDGLGSNLILNIEADAEGNIWCVTQNTVCMVRKKDDKITIYDAQDGLINGFDIKIVKAPNNTLRFLTFNGYYYLDYVRLNHQAPPPPLLITRMMVNNSDFYYENDLKQGAIQLNPSQNTFSFEFAAVDFLRPDKQQYSYQLEGFDKAWINAVNRLFVSYTNIPGGNYTLKIRAYTEGGDNESMMTIPICIGTPFYKRAWFYGLIALIMGGILYLLYRNRIKYHDEIHQLQSKAQALEKEKAIVQYEGLKQQLNPHFLFNSLAALSGLIYSDPKMAGNFLEQMSKIYRYILKNRESTTVFLVEEIKFVTNYIQLQQTRFKQGLQVNINVEEEDYNAKIVPVTLQNLVENAIKHNSVDKESPLVIDIFCEGDYLVVRNNLQKRDLVDTSNRQGLINMQSLYNYLTEKPIIIREDDRYFIIKIPLL
jgi:ligand-binding sensor domain-containing protein